MAQRGRPARDNDDRTEQTRMKKDMMRMIRWIIRIEGGDAVQFIDKILHLGLVGGREADRHDIRRSHLGSD